MGEYFAFTDGIKKSGHYVGGEALQPVHTATTVRVRNGKIVHDRRPVCRDEGAAGRLLPHQGAGSERRHPGGGEDSVGAARQRRGAADRGVRLGRRGRRADARRPVSASDRAREAVDAVYRAESRRVLATLIRLLGDFDLAEEALHDAFAAAVEQWPRDGVPDNPRAWLVSTGRFKAIDALRRRARFDALARGTRRAPGITRERPSRGRRTRGSTTTACG